MTDYSDFKAQITDWINRQDFPDSLISLFIRQGEEKLNNELRVDRMIKFASDLATDRCACLPDDWLEADLVRIANDAAADGYLPIRYKARDEFFNLRDDRAYGYYTIEGRTIYFGGTPDAVNGIAFTMAYYGEVPVFSDTQDSWIYQKYPSLYLHVALMHASLHAVGEEQSAANYKTLAEDRIQKLNADHLRAKASGSRVSRIRRSFG